VKHESPDYQNMPLGCEAVRDLQRLSAWLLGLPDTWSGMFAQRNELARALLRNLLADGQGAALQELQNGFHAAGQAADAAEVLATLDDVARLVARTIMAAWLLGRYLPPETGGPDEGVYADVMGPEVYRQSLVWHLIGATPMGVPQDGTNPWAGPPRVVA
jgi:hypothetical protein